MKIQKISKQLKAVSDRTRFQVLVMLNKHPMVVEAMLKRVKIEASLLSHHLSILKKAGLIKGVKKGRNILYTIHKSCKTGLNLGAVKLVFK